MQKCKPNAGGKSPGFWNRFEEVAEPKILKSTDAIINLSATCICGSDLWPYRGLQSIDGPMHMGHEYCGIVVEVGSAIKTVKPAQFVLGSFPLATTRVRIAASASSRPASNENSCWGAQAPYARVPLADGTLVATDTMPDDDLIPSLLAVSDVLGTGWYAADAARVQPGSTVAVVGDGAVGLTGVLAAKQMGPSVLLP